MIPTSAGFLLFFTAVTALHFAVPCRRRWMVLLAASYLLYALFRVECVLLLAGATAVAYFTAIRMHRTQRLERKKAYLAAGIVTVLGMLVFFKYAGFLTESFGAVVSLFSPGSRSFEFTVLLPVGISFFSFRIVSYLVDVYRGTVPPQTHPGLLALHVSFFPELIAGPIDRAGNLMPQLRNPPGFDHDRVVSGLQLMAWGFFKKLIIADRLSILVNQVYNNPSSYSGCPLIIATYAFAFQIYCDFSGYTDIATGMSRTMGYNIVPNFKRPYFSRSVAEFWRRWHISLSSWFRDYLYIPLGGSRVQRGRRYANIMIVFIVSGLWHGASWMFVIWGALHGAYMVLGDAARGLGEYAGRITGLQRIPRLERLMQMTVTFHLVLFAWIFFRANSMADAGYIISHLFAAPSMLKGDTPLGLSVIQMLIAAGSVAIMVGIETVQHCGGIRLMFNRIPAAVRWVLYAAVVLALINLQPQVKAAFVYMQF